MLENVLFEIMYRPFDFFQAAITEKTAVFGKFHAAREKHTSRSRLLPGRHF
jgi:hypothetical protein